MQQLFQCSRCGAKNYIGQPFCCSCNLQFSYNCPSCGAIVNNTFPNCPNCHLSLAWPGQYQTQPQSSYHQDEQYESGSQAPHKRGLLPWLLGFTGLVLIVMFIGFLAVATGIFPQGTQRPSAVQNTPAQTLPATSNNTTSPKS
jgi:hypothetical protein